MAIQDDSQSHDATASPAAAEAGEDEGVRAVRRAAMDEALKLRREGGTRDASIAVLMGAGIGDSAAAVMIDSFDEMFGTLHGTRPADLSEKVASRLDEVDAKLAAAPQPAELKKSAKVLMAEATAMAAKGRSKDQVVTYLTENGVSGDEAKKVSTRIAMDIAAARAQFDDSKSKAVKSAYWKIGLGILIVIVGLVLMGSGAESSGRRTPLGAVIGGAIMLASGIKELTSVQNQTFQSRVNEVYRS